MKNKVIKTLKWLSIILIAILALGIIIGTIIVNNMLTIKNTNGISYNDEDVYLNIETYGAIINSKKWCIASKSETSPDFNDDWQQITNNKCAVKIHSGDKYLYIRNDKKVGDRINISDYISCIAKIKVNKNNIKMIKGESVKIDITLITMGEPEESVTYKSEDESIAKIEDGKIIGVNDGKTIINISDNYGNSETINVEVTSLITTPQINNSKPFIRNMQYTQDEAKILDEYLFYQIDEAGYGTRAGVVAAARFLSLEFKYRIPYFVENGRLTHFNHQRPYADGEGRYYHRGLFLSKDKFADLEKSSAGPAMWGAYIREWSTDNGLMPNGLDCSGFVCWCMINGGFDKIGDIGGGLSEGRNTYDI